MKINKIAIVLLVTVSLLNASSYREIKTKNELGISQRMSKAQRLAHDKQFRAAYKQEFKRIWNNTVQNRNEYQVSLENKNDFHGIANETFNQYLFQQMKKSYVVILASYYPSDPSLDVTQRFKLNGYADRAVRDYIDEHTCAGCCWLACTGV